MTGELSSALPPAGWYAQSARSARLRWWNGTEWTDHYRDPNAPAAVPPADDGAMTRAARRAAEQQTAPAPVAKVAPDADAEAAAEADDRSSEAPAESEHRPVSIDGDRMPRPVVYRAPSGTTPIAYRETFAPVAASNGATTGAFLLMALSVIAAGVRQWWLVDAFPQAVPFVDLALTGALIIALLLSVVGLFVAAQRPTRKTLPVIALLVSVVLLAGVSVLVVLGTFTAPLAF